MACGFKHSAVLTSDGAVHIFGSSESGRLGLGNTGNKKSPEHLSCLAGYKIGYIACGMAHTVCVTEDGNTVFAFGDNEHGKLGKKKYKCIKIVC